MKIQVMVFSVVTPSSDVVGQQQRMIASPSSLWTLVSHITAWCHDPNDRYLTLQ